VAGVTVGGRQWQYAGRPGPPPPAYPARRGGRVLTPLLLIAGTVLTTLALLAGWATWQLLDENAWGDTGDRLLEREEVRDRVADFIVDEVRAASGGVLPSVIGDGLESRVAEELGSPRAERAWRVATTEAHRDLVRVIEDDRTGSGDVVTLDLDRVIRAVGQELGIPLPFLPQGTGQMTIIEGRQARSVRVAAAELERTAVVLLIAAPLVLLLAVAAASGWRMRALAGAGIAVTVAGVLVLAIRALAGAYVVDVLTPTRPDREAAEAVWSAGTSLLGYMAAAAIVGGLVLALAAGLAARPRERHL
jgi:hypothetical protein